MVALHQALPLPRCSSTLAPGLHNDRDSTREKARMKTWSRQEAERLSNERLVHVVSSALGPVRRRATMARCAPYTYPAGHSEEVFSSTALSRLDGEGIAIFWRSALPVATPNLIVDMHPTLSWNSPTKNYVLARSPHLRESYNVVVELLSRILNSAPTHTSSKLEDVWEDTARATIPRLIAERLAQDPDFIRMLTRKTSSGP